MNRQALGRAGEDYACAALEREGYTVLARNFYTKSGEIDLIVQRGDVIAFVEVKTRSQGKFGIPAEAVTQKKMRAICRSAMLFLEKYKGDVQGFRFDVAQIFENCGTMSMDYIENAFEFVE